MCSVSYAFSQEHVLRCSVLLQLKGYTALALDTLCQSVSDNVTAFKYLLQQAIASRQRVCIVCVCDAWCLCCAPPNSRRNCLIPLWRGSSSDRTL